MEDKHISWCTRRRFVPDSWEMSEWSFMLSCTQLTVTKLYSRLIKRYCTDCWAPSGWEDWTLPWCLDRLSLLLSCRFRTNVTHTHTHSLVWRSCSSSDTEDKQPSAQTSTRLLTVCSPPGSCLPRLSAVCHLWGRWREMWAVRRRRRLKSGPRETFNTRTEKPAGGGKYVVLLQNTCTQTCSYHF